MGSKFTSEIKKKKKKQQKRNILCVYCVQYLCTFCWHANPVEVAGEFLGDVGLAPGW